MKLGIVIANWNGEDVLKICLESLKLQSYSKFKIYIIDNGSKDKSLSIIEEYNGKLDMQVIRLDSNKGFAEANNIAIEKAINDGSEYILTLNNDTELEKNCLYNAVEFIEKQNNKKEFYQLLIVNYFKRGICDCAGITFNKGLIPKQIGFDEKIDEVLNNETKIDGVCAGAAIYSSKALKLEKLKFGYYFDESFFAYYEDVDLSLRLKSNGYKAILLRDSVVNHVHSATGNKISGFKQYYLTRNLLIYTKKNQTKKEYNKNKYIYYYIIFKNILANRKNKDVVKEILRGLRNSKKLKK